MLRSRRRRRSPVRGRGRRSRRSRATTSACASMPRRAGSRGTRASWCPTTARAPLDELMLWRFPERFATRCRRSTTTTSTGSIPYRFNPGHMRTGAVVVDGRAASVEVRDHPRAGKGTLVARRARSAARAGRVGDGRRRLQRRGAGALRAVRLRPRRLHADRLLSDGGAAPAGALDGVPGRGRYRLSVGVHDTADVVVNGELRALERGGRLDFDVGDAPGLSLIVGRPRLRRSRRRCAA